VKVKVKRQIHNLREHNNMIYDTSVFNEREREYTESEKAKESSKTAICLCEFEVGEKVCALPCDNSHIFHTKCIKQWLESNRVCPVCRTFITISNH
jgi:hypothetical protein